jgi:hypothetical protein
MRAFSLVSPSKKARFAACHEYWLKLLISTMNLKFMFLANNQTESQNRLINNAKPSAVTWPTKPKTPLYNYQIFAFKISIFKCYYQIIHVHIIIVHDLIHYAYMCCITYAVLGEERTNSEYSALLI